VVLGSNLLGTRLTFGTASTEVRPFELSRSSMAHGLRAFRHVLVPLLLGLNPQSAMWTEARVSALFFLRFLRFGQQSMKHLRMFSSRVARVALRTVV